MYNDGKYLEKLVHVIEQSIAPDSIVEHNVSLPIIGSKIGAAAQCDIVIRTGKKPRETITIIEVQDRNKPVDINDFRGWQQKLTDVGAQHLYCVSTKEFPGSIKEKAALSGNTIKLITLKELHENEIPITLFNFIFQYHDPDILHIKRNKTSFDQAEIQNLGIEMTQVERELKTLKTNDLKFSTNKKDLMALSTLCIQNIKTNKDVISETSELELGYDKKAPLFFFINGGFISICIGITYTWSYKIISVPVSVLSYEQNEFGALAWVLESFYQSSRGPIWFKIPVVKKEDSYSISGGFLTMPVNTVVGIKLEKRKKHG
jgi:hypothetical protein